MTYNSSQGPILHVTSLPLAFLPVYLNTVLSDKGENAEYIILIKKIKIFALDTSVVKFSEMQLWQNSVYRGNQY